MYGVDFGYFDMDASHRTIYPALEN